MAAVFVPFIPRFEGFITMTIVTDTIFKKGAYFIVLMLKRGWLRVGVGVRRIQ